jgi:hypothetical protein
MALLLCGNEESLKKKKNFIYRRKSESAELSGGVPGVIA